MTVNDLALSDSPTSSILDAPSLWPAQAHTPTVAGRQLVVERGEGSWLYTADGRKLFDGTAGLWHANVGHVNAEPAQAAYEKMLQLATYHIFARSSTDKARELAEKLAALSPIPREKIILNPGG